jgi:glycosyltransferase involved in cell wall biosynthesis
MNIAYLVWLEELGTPILEGQTVEVLEEIARDTPGHRLHLFAFQPVYRLLLRPGKVQEVRERMEAAGVSVTVIPVVSIPQIDLFRARWYVMPLVLLKSLPALLTLCLLKRIQVLHCRSYPITWAAIWAKRLLGVRVIFDPRSDFPEENVTAGNWRGTSPSHRIWKHLERTFLEEADATIAISRTYMTHYGDIADGVVFRVIPNNVDTGRFKTDTAFREDFRRERGIGKDTVVFCYCGSMGAHWHTPDLYFEFIKGMRDLKVPHWTLFITQQHDVLERLMVERGIHADEAGVAACDFGDVARYLSAADFGLMLMRDPKIALGVKTVEYLALGLPVIANENARGAADLIRDTGAGLVLEDPGSPDIEELESLVGRREDLSQECRRLAARHFSTGEVAKQYAQLYDDLARQSVGIR